ncbi:MAG: protein-L-isoaspartate O-methyltransferase [Pseudomonadales bacterium]|nr:protein-L-isoaspartate O-methyltransferase [Pseudomonadales bacterium]
MQRQFKGIGMTSQRTRDRLIKRLTDQGICDLRVLDVIQNMPRHIFIDEALSHRAYEDTALPIGYNQTISQPYIVAKMTETLLAGTSLAGASLASASVSATSLVSGATESVRIDDKASSKNVSPKKVLEIGSGSGYQSAILSQFFDSVYSVERIKELHLRAREKLRSLNIRNVYLRHVGQEVGWADRGPFDAILVTAAPNRVPEQLLDQLAVGGRMVIPVGGERQELKLIVRTEDDFTETVLETVKFVPFVSGVS